MQPRRQGLISMIFSGVLGRSDSFSLSRVVLVCFTVCFWVVRTEAHGWSDSQGSQHGEGIYKSMLEAVLVLVLVVEQGPELLTVVSQRNVAAAVSAAAWQTVSEVLVVVVLHFLDDYGHVEILIKFIFVDKVDLLLEDLLVPQNLFLFRNQVLNLGVLGLDFLVEFLKWLNLFVRIVLGVLIHRH